MHHNVNDYFIYLKIHFQWCLTKSVFLSRPEVANSNFGRGCRLSDWDFYVSSISVGESQHSIMQQATAASFQVLNIRDNFPSRFVPYKPCSWNNVVKWNKTNQSINQSVVFCHTCWIYCIIPSRAFHKLLHNGLQYVTDVSSVTTQSFIVLWLILWTSYINIIINCLAAWSHEMIEEAGAMNILVYFDLNTLDIRAFKQNIFE
jgi:hypothetical protein